MTSSTTGARLGSAEDILRRAGQVPARDSFPSIDELWSRFADIQSRHPDLVSSRRVATSRLGEPILAYELGSGSKNHLIVGGVHPNEPIGSWTAIHLAESLADDPALLTALDARWTIVPSIDPDGARLNEGWFANSGDRNFYSRRFYRPAPEHQVEWSFPFAHKKAYFDRVLPETQGLMRLIDEIKPDLYVSLHNGEMGGVYYYLSRPVPELYGLLHAVPASLGLPLDTGEPESPFLEQYAPAIFGTGRLSDAYDYLENLGVDATTMTSGSSSSEYALKYGTLSLVAELPYWKHADADDTTPIDENYGALLHRTAALMRATGNTLGALLDAATPHLTLETPFLHASRVFVPMLVTMAATDDARADLPAADRAATVAERFGCEDIVTCFRLRYGGMLLRALESEVNAGVAPAEVHRLARELDGVYARWQTEAAAANTAVVIPIATLVGVQFGAVLAAASHVGGLLDTEDGV
ncbi:M14 family zinc carboxypeptidase [Conyzicola sp.]|uniref:M14 family zinc carboxypeptidase n=1 Tax=Conyzicola sp. TaxID=1969404 RepID=UPI003988A347